MPSSAALELADATLARVAKNGGEAKVKPLLERVRAWSLLQKGDTFRAREALETGLSSARSRSDLFELALTLLALIELDKLEGVEPPAEIVAESAESSLAVEDPRGAASARQSSRSDVAKKAAPRGRFSD